MNSTDLEITWIPSHPGEGWESMNRYWSSIWEERDKSLSINSALGKPVMNSKRLAKFQKIWIKKFYYPSILRRFSSSKVWHVLDQSYAEMLRYAPRGIKKVVTLHDLLPLRKDSGLSKGEVRRYLARVTWMKEADIIISASDYSANEAVSLLNIEERKIRIIPLGVESKFFSYDVDCKVDLLGKVGPEKKIILVIGSNIGRKNLKIIPDIMSQVEVKEKYVIVKVGANFPGEIRKRLDLILEREAVVELGYVDECMLPYLYHKSDLLLFPSLCEGFGLPLLEAMAAGCNVVSSNATSLPEVGKGSVLYFNPLAPNEAAEQINKLNKDRNLAKSLQKRGRGHAEKMTWKRHVDKLSEVYQSLS